MPTAYDIASPVGTFGAIEVSVEEYESYQAATGIVRPRSLGKEASE